MTTAFQSSLWAHDSDYIIQFEPSWKWDIDTKPGLFSFEFGIPVFMGITDYVTTPGKYDALDFYLPGFSYSSYHSETWPRLLSDPYYLFSYLKVLEWSVTNFRVSYSPDIDLSPVILRNIIWSNPFYDPLTGFLNRYITLNYFSGKFQTSSLTDPGFLYSDYQISFSKEKSGDFWKDFVLYPLAWVNLKTPDNPDYGVGISVRTGDAGKKEFSGALQIDTHVYHMAPVSENLSYRLDAHADLLLSSLGFTAGYIYKSPNHPAGPLLSPLFVSRTASDYDSFSRNHGISVGIIPGSTRYFEFSLISEIYPENGGSYSLRAQVSHKWNKNTVKFAYIHEEMENWDDFLNHRNKNTFVEFEFSAYLIPERFLVSLKEVLCFSDEEGLKTLFSITSFF